VGNASFVERECWRNRQCFDLRRYSVHANARLVMNGQSGRTTTIEITYQGWNKGDT